MSVLMDPRRTADCERFEKMTGRLRGLQLNGDDLAGRALWMLSHGPRFIAIDMGRTLATAWSAN
jgi:hypothetical protein